MPSAMISRPPTGAAGSPVKMRSRKTVPVTSRSTGGSLLTASSSAGPGMAAHLLLRQSVSAEHSRARTLADTAGPALHAASPVTFVHQLLTFAQNRRYGVAHACPAPAGTHPGDAADPRADRGRRPLPR